MVAMVWESGYRWLTMVSVSLFTIILGGVVGIDGGDGLGERVSMVGDGIGIVIHHHLGRGGRYRWWRWLGELVSMVAMVGTTRIDG